MERKKEKKVKDQERKKERGKREIQKEGFEDDEVSSAEISSTTIAEAEKPSQVIHLQKEKVNAKHDDTKPESKSSSKVISEGVLRLPRKFKVEADEYVFKCSGCSKDQKLISSNFVIQG
ncbi:hypothetical protein C5167_007596, partial [Papaver somniferum]